MTRHTYSIKEAAALTGLPASTLRYYESIGVIEPVGRGESSGHRAYTDDDCEETTWGEHVTDDEYRRSGRV